MTDAHRAEEPAEASDATNGFSNSPITDAEDVSCCGNCKCSRAACQSWCDRSNRAARAFICTFVFTCTVISALVICSCLVIKPYLISKDFELADCRTRNVTYWEQWCCLRVLVQYRDLSNRRHLAYIIEDEYSLLDGHHASCSYVSCVTEKVKKWETKYGQVGSTFKCHFNPYDSAQVIRQKRFNETVLLHSVLWPIGLILGGCIVMLVLVKVAKLNVRGDIYSTPLDTAVEDRDFFFNRQETSNPISRPL